MTAPPAMATSRPRTSARGRAVLGFVLVLGGLRTDLAEAAVAALEEDGLDTTGAGFQKTQVTLIEGGN